jgi:hypothetical protein
LIFDINGFFIGYSAADHFLHTLTEKMVGHCPSNTHFPFKNPGFILDELEAKSFFPLRNQTISAVSVEQKLHAVINGARSILEKRIFAEKYPDCSAGKPKFPI